MHKMFEKEKKKSSKSS